MADEILEKARDVFEGQIDFKGQQLAEFLATALLTLVGAIAFIVGYVKQDIKLALALGLIGTVLAFVLIVPPWPYLKRHPIKWLPVGGEAQDIQVVVDGQLVG